MSYLATQTLHAQLSLNRDRWCKTHVNQRLFFFCHLYRVKFASFSSRNHTSEIRFCGSTTEYRINTKSLVTVTFLLFSMSRCPKATGVPSPTISMVQRTALRLLVNFLLKQVTVIRLRFRQNSGLFSFGLDRSLRDQTRWHFT